LRYTTQICCNIFMSEHSRTCENAKLPDSPLRAVALSAIGRWVGVNARKPTTGRIFSHTEPFLRPSDNFDPRKIDVPTAEAARFYINTGYWHGTGRFQYNEDQAPIDILQKIAQDRELQPANDPFNLERDAVSLSLAFSRVYARSYADMHGLGSHEPNRYGTAHYWVRLFTGDIGMELVKESGGLRQFRKKQKQEVKDLPDWSHKIRKEKTAMFDLFKEGSDIEGNYPVLLGIRAESVAPIPTLGWVGLHEVRSATQN
jgi:hypothetical protein